VVPRPAPVVGIPGRDARSCRAGAEEFDAIFGRIGERGVTFGADPGQTRPGEINHHGGRGCYPADPGGHLLEIITWPYGSG
jgi:hypothetical protein